MAISIIAHASAGNGVGQTPNRDTTGATVLLLMQAVAASDPMSVSDSNNNTWTGNGVISAFGREIEIWSAVPPVVVGAGHNFAGSGAANRLVMIAIAGADLTGGFLHFSVSDNSALGGGLVDVTTTQPGSLSGAVGDLFLAFAYEESVTGTGGSFDSSFSVLEEVNDNTFGLLTGYKIASGSGSENPTFTFTTSNHVAVAALAQITAASGGGITYEGSVEFDVTAALARTTTLDMSPALSMAATAAFSDSPGNVINASRSLAASVASAFSNTQDSVGSISLSAILAIARSNTLDAQASATLSTIVAFATTGGNVFDSSVQVDVLAAAVFSTFRGTAAAITASTVAACSSASSIDAVGSITASTINSINNSVNATLVALQSIGVHPQVQLAAGFDLFSTLTLLVSALLSTAGSFPGNDPLLISLVAERLQEAGLTGSTLSTVDVDDETLRSGQ